LPSKLVYLSAGSPRCGEGCRQAGRNPRFASALLIEQRLPVFPLKTGKEFIAWILPYLRVNKFRQPGIMTSEQRWAKVLFGAFSSKRKREKE
jgi:hypothetical protein